MSKGEQAQALGQSLQKSFATRWAPVGGDFCFGDLARRPARRYWRQANCSNGATVTCDGIPHHYADVCSVPINDPSATGDTFANGINDKGQIVGYYSGSGGFHGFLYNNGIYTAPSQIAT